jgi:hypothetical protein
MIRRGIVPMANGSDRMSEERPAGRTPPPQRPPPGIDPIGRGCEIKPPNRQDAWTWNLPADDREIPVGPLTLALIAALGLAWLGGVQLYRWVLERPPLTGDAAVQAVVARIIVVESNGDPNAKNKRSSATGAGQFLDATWLEMIRTHRPDLAQGRGEKEVLELRRRPELAREITTRWVERSAAMLSKRGLPVTPGTLYLTYFAGPAGAVAILSVAEHADAAALMAGADATGRTTREKIVNANPFLGTFTVGDLKDWADRKMRGL